MYSAGILIYCVHDNDIFLLLGRDSKYKTWSDFGGKNETIDEKNERKTACREFFEETCGTLFDKHVIFEKLKNYKPYLCQSYMKNPYYMFMMKIDYEEYKNVGQHFDIIRSQIHNLKSFSYKYKEKDSIRWINLKSVLNAPNDYRCVFYKSLIQNLTHLV